MSWEGVADVGRTMALIGAAITFAISVGVAADGAYRTYSQLCRFLGLASLSAGLALGEYHSLGHRPFWPVLILLWVGVALSLAGTLPLALSRNRSASLKPKENP